MLFYLLMVVFSPYVAIIPAIYSTYLLFKKEVEFENNYWNITILVLFIWGVLVAIINRSILSFLGVFLLLGYLGVQCYAQKYFITREKINIVMKYLVYLTSLCAINAIAEVIALSESLSNKQFKAVSNFGNPNMAAAWFASILLVILYLKSIERTKIENTIYNVATGVIFIAFVLTKSAGAFAAFIIGLLSYIVISNLNNKKKILIIMLTVIIGISGVFYFDSKLEEPIITGEITSSFVNRIDIWQATEDMIIMKPITGWGILSNLEYGAVYDYGDGQGIHAHNLWLALWVSFGVVGLLVYLIGRLYMYKDILSLIKKKESLVPLILSLNVVMVVQGVVDVSLYAPQLGILFVGTSAITLNLVKDKIK